MGRRFPWSVLAGCADGLARHGRRKLPAGRLYGRYWMHIHKSVACLIVRWICPVCWRCITSWRRKVTSLIFVSINRYPCWLLCRPLPALGAANSAKSTASGHWYVTRLKALSRLFLPRTTPLGFQAATRSEVTPKRMLLSANTSTPTQDNPKHCNTPVALHRHGLKQYGWQASVSARTHGMKPCTCGALRNGGDTVSS